MFVPFYGIYYSIKHWKETRIHSIVLVSGLATTIIGTFAIPFIWIQTVINPIMTEYLEKHSAEVIQSSYYNVKRIKVSGFEQSSSSDTTKVSGYVVYIDGDESSFWAEYIKEDGKWKLSRIKVY